MRDLSFWAVMSLGTLAVIALAIVAFSFLGDWRCSIVSKQLETQYKYGLISGCIVKTANGWVPLDHVRYTQ